MPVKKGCCSVWDLYVHYFTHLRTHTHTHTQDLLFSLATDTPTTAFATCFNGLYVMS